jgi:hypothetical protein
MPVILFGRKSIPSALRFDSGNYDGIFPVLGAFE